MAGDAILDSDSLMPQIAVGLQHKTLGSTGFDGTLNALGAKRSGIDFYISAAKIFLGQSLLVNGTLRATKANQNGLLGYGAKLGGNEDRYSLQPEFQSAIWQIKTLWSALNTALCATSRRCRWPRQWASVWRLERHLYCQGTKQKPVAHLGLC